jgi:hypothetical protein
MDFDKALNGFPHRLQKYNLLLGAPHKAVHTQLGIGVYLPLFPLAAARYQRSSLLRRLYTPHTGKRQAKHSPPPQKR